MGKSLSDFTILYLAWPKSKEVKQYKLRARSQVDASKQAARHLFRRYPNSVILDSDQMKAERFASMVMR